MGYGNIKQSKKEKSEKDLQMEFQNLQNGGEKVKKVIMAVTVVCLGLLFGTGCGIEEEDALPSLSSAEKAEKLKDLAAFCNEHREKLNEMSEYFLDAVEDVSDYEDDGKLPDIDELAGTFTDEESKEVLEKLDPYYPSGYGSKFKQVYYYYEGGYANAAFRVLYIEADWERLEEFLDLRFWEEVQKIDKHLFAVIEYWGPGCDN